MTDIAITGIGVISALGIGRERFWESCRNATSGIKKITSFETSFFKSDVAACVEGFDPKKFMPPGVSRRMGRISQMAVASSVEAVKDSGIELDTANKDRIAIVMGTAYGKQRCGTSQLEAASRSNNCRLIPNVAAERLTPRTRCAFTATLRPLSSQPEDCDKGV